jgi:hypothetical protein
MLPLLAFYLVFRLFYLPSFGLELGALGNFPLRNLGDGSYATADGGRLSLKWQEVAGEESAKALVADSRMLIDGLYGKRVNPYRGMISAEIVCSEKEAIPVVANEAGDFGIKVTYRLMANEARLYGVCDPKDFAHRSFFVVLYCRKQQRLFRVKYFGKLEMKETELAALAHGVKCPQP